MRQRLNGRMKKSRVIFVGGVFLGTLISFQNCSKVAVEDTSISALAAAGSSATGEVSNNDGGVATILDGSGTTTGSSSSNSQVDMSSTSTSSQGSSTTTTMPSTSSSGSTGGSTVSSGTGSDSSAGSGIGSSTGSTSTTETEDSGSSPLVCKRVNELGIDHRHGKMHSLKCLKDQTESCVVVCHHPAMKEKTGLSKLVHSDEALKAHLAHGDTLGFCSDNQDQQVCESDEHEKRPKKYHKEDKGRHYDERGKSCGRSDEHEHRDLTGEDAGEDRDDDRPEHRIDDPQSK